MLLISFCRSKFLYVSSLFNLKHLAFLMVQFCWLLILSAFIDLKLCFFFHSQLKKNVSTRYRIQSRTLFFLTFSTFLMPFHCLLVSSALDWEGNRHLPHCCPLWHFSLAAFIFGLQQLDHVVPRRDFLCIVCLEITGFHEYIKWCFSSKKFLQIFFYHVVSHFLDSNYTYIRPLDMFFRPPRLCAFLFNLFSLCSPD